MVAMVVYSGSGVITSNIPFLTLICILIRKFYMMNKLRQEVYALKSKVSMRQEHENNF